MDGVFFGNRGVAKGATDNSRLVEEDLKQAKKGILKPHKKLLNKKPAVFLFALGTVVMLLASTSIGMGLLLAAVAVLVMGMLGVEIKAGN